MNKLIIHIDVQTKVVSFLSKKFTENMLYLRTSKEKSYNYRKCWPFKCEEALLNV